MKQTVTEFFESIKGKRIALIGMGRSHMPLIPLFTKYGADVYACDKRERDALGEAASIGKRSLPVAVIDTENGFVKLGLAKKLAKEMNASYFQMDKLSEDGLLRVWRRTAARA